MKRFIQTAGIVVFAGILLFLSFNYHNKNPVNNYKSPIWADKAGYYVYLPAAFLYGFDPGAFPEKADDKTGNGFFLEDGKVRTKYTYGVALMQAPFFLTAHATAVLTDAEADGFSRIYTRSVNIAAVFYLLAGMLLLYRVLNKYYKKLYVILSLVTLFFGTNLYYYAIQESGMSHVYSFALFSLMLFAAQNFSEQKNKLRNFIIFSLALALATVIRPTNLLFGTVIFFIDIETFSRFKERFKSVVTLKHILISAVAGVIFFLPQFAYWKYLHGSFIVDSYEGEGFIYYADPKILSVLFNPLNGLILYSAVWIFILLAMFLFLRKNKWLGGFTAAVFVLVVYLSASWHSWYFGCSYGMRQMVEYYALFAFPFTYLIQKISLSRRLILKVIAGAGISFLIYFNMKLMYTFDKCFYGTSDWDWKEYVNYLDRSKVLGFTTDEYTFFDDFEYEGKIKFVYKRTHLLNNTEKAFSGTGMCRVDSSGSCGFKGKLSRIGPRVKQLAEVEVMVFMPEEAQSGTLYTRIKEYDTPIFQDSLSIENVNPGEWNKITHRVTLPDVSQDHILYINLIADNNKDFYADDLKVRFEY